MLDAWNLLKKAFSIEEYTISLVVGFFTVVRM
jgi:hypothetical protein